jgi:hypothetical protein
MSVLRSLEEKIAGLVEGTFGRVFRSEVRPVEIARKLVKEMDDHRTVSLSRTYVPNTYVIWLSPEDRDHYAGVEHEVLEELSAHLLEHARGERLSLVGRPQLSLRVDDRLRLGEFGIETRSVREGDGAAPAAPVAPASPGPSSSDTMVASSAIRHREALDEVRPPRGARPRAVIVSGGKRLVIADEGSVLGRSRESDIVLEDTNISRRHARIFPDGEGWAIEDLGSTNGVRVNGRRIDGSHRLGSGDELELGTVAVSFEVQD